MERAQRDPVPEELIKYKRKLFAKSHHPCKHLVEMHLGEKDYLIMIVIVHVHRLIIPTLMSCNSILVSRLTNPPYSGVKNIGKLRNKISKNPLKY